MARGAEMSYYNKPQVTLPVNHSDRDAVWLSEQLLKLKPQHRITACVGYSQAYTEAFTLQDVEHKKENAARKAANTRLRHFVKRCLDDERDKIMKPAIEAYNQMEYQAQQNSTNFSIDSL
jgi:hypothetical protein